MSVFRRILLAGAWVSLVLAGCIEHAQSRVSYEARAIVTVTPTIVKDDWTLTLRVAKLAFGPAYFCAAATGLERCEPALSELLEVRVLDLLDAAPQPLGTVVGVTGEIRSASYDLGIHWLATEAAATASLGNVLRHSAYFEGEARKGAYVVPFRAVVELPPQQRGQRAVGSIAAAGRVSDATKHLDVRIDYADWLSKLDLPVELSGEPIRIVPTTPAHTSIVLGMTSRSPLRFEWTNE